MILKILILLRATLTKKLFQLKFVKTLICQAHLSPLPLHVVPIYWNYDHVMRLYPLPDLVVVADKQRAYTHTNSECTVINPGSFPFNNFSFKVYVPSTKQVEDCAIPNEQ